MTIRRLFLCLSTSGANCLYDSASASVPLLYTSLNSESLYRRYLMNSLARNRICKEFLLTSFFVSPLRELSFILIAPMYSMPYIPIHFWEWSLPMVLI